MKSAKVDLPSISVEYLYEGLILKDDIYDHSGKLLLIARKTKLTEALITRLKKFSESKNIRVSKAMHKELMEKGLPVVYQQEYLEDKVGYTEIKKDTRDMLDDIDATHKVEYEHAVSITGSLTDKLETTDPALLFQCINGHNEIDEYLYRHSMNVALLNGYMGNWLKLPPEDVNTLVIAGLMHDVGKIMIPKSILDCPRKLTPNEFEIIKKHPVYSYNMLVTTSNFNDAVCTTALRHHEKINGSGYPDKLMAEKIPYFAKITSIADIYDAMVSKRSYKNAQNPFVILMQLKNQQFSDLDMGLVKLFTDIMPTQLLGKQVLMSDGSVGEIKIINENDFEHPIVDINGEIIVTNKNLYIHSLIVDDEETPDFHFIPEANG